MNLFLSVILGLSFLSPSSQYQHDYVPQLDKWTPMMGDQIISFQVAWKDLTSRKLSKEQKNLSNYKLAFWRGKESDHISFSPIVKKGQRPPLGNSDPKYGIYIIYEVSTKTRKILKWVFSDY